MLDKITTANEEKALLVGVTLPETTSWVVEEHLDELEQLALTAGAKIVGRIMQERSRIDSRYFLGKGKIEEIALFVEENEIGIVIFDDDLSPAQLRNIEKKVETKIIDRSALILDIFASHARSREAKTQVELAQLQYMLPRLTRQWTHLSRQVGGIGTKGPGETQLETDRRLVRTRIQRLKGELEKIEKQRAVRRKGRDSFFKVALVGYTNVGKSTIMNILSNSDVLVQNQLFATLDSTVRKVHLDYGKEILLSDTVGFIRKLPHNLVASFRSTLEEAREADLLLHVVDVGQDNYEEQMEIVKDVLRDLEIDNKNVMLVFNKIDLVEESGMFRQLKTRFSEAVFVSAIKNMGVNHLKQKIMAFYDKEFITTGWQFPVQDMYRRQILIKNGVILQENMVEDHLLWVVSRIPKPRYEKMLKENAKLKEYIVEYDGE